MKMNTLRLFALLPLLWLSSCSSEKKEEKTTEHEVIETVVEKKEQTPETKAMVSSLENLVNSGNPRSYLHWNSRKADMLYDKIHEPNQPHHGQLWFEYCTQLLRAGRTEECIVELESHFDMSMPLASQMRPNNYLLFELLALAYLRLGEQQNCQKNHTAFSCILPLKEPAIHTLTEGSEKALDLYCSMYDRAPSEKYKWLINLAHYTLGTPTENIPKKYALNFPNWKLEQKDFPRFKEVAMNAMVAQNGLSGGTCLDDFNNDGLLDIFATAYGMSEQAVLYLNKGDGTFEDATQDALLNGIVSGLNCVHADYNNDGFKDVLILRGAWLGTVGSHPNSLLKNNGDGTFSDVTKSAGILSHHPTQTAAWADYDKDGYLDLFIGNESDTLGRLHHPCELYHNNGDGTFTEVSASVGLGTIQKFVKGVTWGDINNDQWPDLFLSISKDKNMLFKNNEGTFENISESAGITEPIYSFPCWFWDANQDGYQDLFVGSYDTRYFGSVSEIFAREIQGIKTDISIPRLFINNGDETFSDQTKAYGLNKPIFAMGSNFGDLDNDGYLDFYIGTGSPDYTAVVPNRMFRNVNGKGFEEVTSAGGFGHIQKGHGVAFADIDRDGDQDVYAVMGGAFEGDNFTNVLFENPGFEHHWIILELEGVNTNRSAIGTKIEVKLDNGKTFYQTVGTGSSFGANSLQVEIGLGKAEKIDQLIIHWQNGTEQTFSDVVVNQKIKIVENETNYTVVDYTHIPFSKISGDHVHQH